MKTNVVQTSIDGTTIHPFHVDEAQARLAARLQKVIHTREIAANAATTTLTATPFAAHFTRHISKYLHYFGVSPGSYIYASGFPRFLLPPFRGFSRFLLPPFRGFSRLPAVSIDWPLLLNVAADAHLTWYA